MTRLQEINARGWAKGWYADMLAIHAKHSGLTMAEQFVKQIEHASARRLLQGIRAADSGKGARLHGWYWKLPASSR